MMKFLFVVLFCASIVSASNYANSNWMIVGDGNTLYEYANRSWNIIRDVTVSYSNEPDLDFIWPLRVYYVAERDGEPVVVYWLDGHVPSRNPWPCYDGQQLEFWDGRPPYYVCRWT